MDIDLIIKTITLVIMAIMFTFGLQVPNFKENKQEKNI